MKITSHLGTKINIARRPLALALGLALNSAPVFVSAATIQVTTVGDASNASTCTLRQAIISMNSGTIVSASNCVTNGSSFGTNDTVTFAATVTSVTLADTPNNELLISDPMLTIQGTGVGGVTISRPSGGANAFRIFHDTASGGSALSLIGLTITNGYTTTANASGAAIAMTNSPYPNLTVTDCVITGNSTTGMNAVGGAIAAGSVGSNHGSVTMTNSVVSGNSTDNIDAGGGGVYATGLAYLKNSSVTGNFTTKNSSPGGGIQANDVRLAYCSISDNSTRGDSSPGGGIAATGFHGSFTGFGDVISYNSTAGSTSAGGGINTYYMSTLNNDVILSNVTTGDSSDGGGIYISGLEGLKAQSTTISNNRATGDLSGGGGVWARFGQSIAGQLRGSTVSGNVASVGGGIVVNACSSTASADFDVYNSTIAFNTSAHSGGGLYIGNNGCAVGGSTKPTYAVVNITSSIIANNASESPDSFDIGAQASFPATITTSFDLIQNVPTAIGITIDNSSSSPAIIQLDPLLNPLANNGCGTLSGATQCVPTLAIGCRSPAYNAGANPLNFQYDERGMGYPRIGGAKIDIGSYEDDDEIFCNGFELTGSVQ